MFLRAPAVRRSPLAGRILWEAPAVGGRFARILWGVGAIFCTDASLGSTSAADVPAARKRRKARCLWIGAFLGRIPHWAARNRLRLAPAVQHFAPDGAVLPGIGCVAFVPVLSLGSTSAADVPAAKQSRLAGGLSPVRGCRKYGRPRHPVPVQCKRDRLTSRQAPHNIPQHPDVPLSARQDLPAPQ